MGRDYFVEEAGSELEYDCHQDIPARFVIQPVHQQHERDDANHEICAVYPPGLDQIALVIIPHPSQGYVPDGQENAEQQRRHEQAHPAPQAVCTVGMPAEFFHHRSED